MKGEQRRGPPEEIRAKEQALEQRLRKHASAAVAFSGGGDSTYLLFKAAEVLGADRVLAFTVASKLTIPGEAKTAQKAAERMNVAHRLLEVNLLSDPELRGNSPERCYICKKRIYGELLRLAKENRCEAVLDGSNADDTGEYRPGLRALRELNVSSPLLEAQLGKEEIRYLSKQVGLSTWNKPSAACLASRIPYGEELNPEKLEKIAAAEKFLRQVGVVNNLRVRCHGTLARIEVDRNSFDLLQKRSEEIIKKFRALGFTYITLDLDGFQSGSMDRSFR